MRVKTNGLGWNFWQNFDFQVKKTWVVFYKTYRKTFLALSIKEMDQFIIFFVALVRGVVIEPPAFGGAHNCTDLKIWAYQFEVRR